MLVFFQNITIARTRFWKLIQEIQLTIAKKQYHNVPYFTKQVVIWLGIYRYNYSILFQNLLPDLKLIHEVWKDLRTFDSPDTKRVLLERENTPRNFRYSSISRKTFHRYEYKVQWRTARLIYEYKSRYGKNKYNTLRRRIL